MPKTATAIDPRSDETVLALVEGASAPHGVPERDLHGADINRLAYIRALAKQRDERSLAVTPGEEPEWTPRPPDFARAGMLEAIADELVASGSFTRVKPSTTEQPASPAEQPEA